MQKMQGAIPTSSGIGFRVYPFIQEDVKSYEGPLYSELAIYASNHMSCFQSFGPLQLMDYIAARNIYGHKMGS